MQHPCKSQRLTRPFWLTSSVLFLVTFAVFSRVLVADFVQWDDSVSVYQNPHIQGLDWARLCWMFGDASYGLRYEPLSWLAYALIYHFSGLNPSGYHFANLLLHSLNTVLVFMVIRRLLAAGSTGSEVAGRLETATLPAAIGTLLWAVNPLRVEPVAHVTDLRYCLLLFFLMISLWSYLRAHQAGQNARGQRWFYWCSVAAFALSMLSLPFAVGYVFVLAALDWYPLRRFESCSHCWRDAKARKVLLEKIPFLLLGGIMLATIVARLNPTGVWAAYKPDSTSSLFSRVMQALYVWAYYGWKPWVPFHLSPMYTTLLDFNPNTWPFWLSAALIIGATVLLVRRRHRWPGALALWVTHLVLLVQVLGLTERPHYTVDRYDYLPGLVWAIAIAAALGKISSLPRLRAAGMICAAVLGVLWGTLSVRQTRVWHDSVALFTHTLRELGTHPYSAEIHWRLGSVLASEGKIDEAARHCQTSLQIQPRPEIYLAFAQLMETNGNPEAALTNYQELIQLYPDPDAFAKVGQLMSQLGRSGEAISFYRGTLVAFPNLAPVQNNLAWLLASSPDATNRNGSEAVYLAEQACALTERHHPLLLGTLAAAYAEAGRFTEAIQTAQEARDLAQAAGQPEVAEKNRQLLELYRSGKACREPPPPAHGASRPVQ